MVVAASDESAPAVAARAVPGQFMGRKLVCVVFAALVAVLVVEMVVLSEAPSARPRYVLSGAAAFLGLIGAVAVGIERVLETFWTVVGLVGNSWWPMGPLGKQYKEAIAELDRQLSLIFGHAARGIATLQGPSFPDVAAEKAAQLRYVRTQIEALKDAVPTNEQVKLLASEATRAVDLAQSFLNAPEVTAAAVLAKDAIADLDSFVATFQDNPRRRLISIYVGSLLGVLVAGLLGLDLIHPALGVDARDLTSPYWATVLTGLVMGLGSSPTHEAIRLIQEFKKRTKAANRE